MAAEMVVWDNLRRSLERNEVKALPHTGEFQSLRESVVRAKGALMTLEAGEKLDSQVTPSRLEHLVALLHEADDLLDSILPSATCRRLRRAILCVQMAVPLRKISHDISEVVRELEHKFPSTHVPDREFDKPDYRAAESKLIGREKVKDDIIKMLIPNKRNSKNSKCFVIPVVGSSGLGKSTLVRSVYEDEKVENHFDLRMWIHVSHISDEGEIIREIVESCTSRKSNYSEKSQPAKNQHQQKEGRFFDILGCQSSGRSVVTPHYRIDKKKEDIIERRLRKEIEGKLYLLVLDDASIKQWSRLKNLLAGGATGSRILVSTNFVEVGNLAKTENDKIYKLEGLSFEDSLSLFKESALGEEGKFADEESERIGRSIVRTCKGVPFTLRVAGSLVCGKGVEKWSSFDNDIRFSSKDEEEDVTEHILEHSYNNLPYRLKACIGYCSLFPEGFEFNKRDLISLWMAQGFVHAQNDQSEEDAGEMYFLELSRCYFFHKVRKDNLGYIVACKMHPLMHNLVRQKDTLAVNIHIGDNNDVINIPKYKHLSFSCNTDSSIKIPPSLLRAQTLRTLLSLKEADCGAKLDTKECNKLISKFKHLRVLDLHDLRIQQLPDSIGSLIHLRYLDLSKNDLKALPKSVTKLYNLQTLKLNSCAKLSRLEGNYGELVNLKRFKLDGCDSLTGMPLGLDRLTQLQLLSRFVVGKDYHSTDPQSVVGLQALKQLNSLRRRLEIEFIGDWMENIDEAEHAQLQNKSHLIELKINWAQPNLDFENSSALLSEEDKLRYQNLLEHLQPHSTLKILCIEGYKGEDFPSWAMSASSLLPNLVVVSIEGCDKCECLPPFGALRALKRLTLRHMVNVKYMESSTSAGNQEAMQELPSFFESLEELTLHNFHKLKRWRKETMSPSRRNPQVRCFPNLNKLRIWNCPRLISMPLFQKVLDLDLRNINQSLLEECAKNVSMITRPTNSFCIKYLQIQRCPNLNNFKSVRKGLGGLSQLEQLVIDRCDTLAFLASELRYLTALKKLEISGCEELDLSDNRSHNMDTNDMASWMSLGTLQNLTLGGVLGNPWSSLKNLRELTLKEIPKMKTLPEGMKHVQNLRFLWLSACYALEELPEWISNLTMLQQFRIESCPALRRLPEAIQEVTSLIKVEITGCPDLMERCKEHTGEDWHKIKNARILLHKSWRYGLMSELGATQNGSQFRLRTLDDVKYLIIPVLPVDELA